MGNVCRKKASDSWVKFLCEVVATAIVVSLLFGMFRTSSFTAAQGSGPLDDIYVNEEQRNSITSAMIMDGQIQQSDLNFVAMDTSSFFQTIVGEKIFTKDLYVAQGQIELDSWPIGGAAYMHVRGANGDTNVYLGGFLELPPPFGIPDVADRGVVLVSRADGVQRAGMGLMSCCCSSTGYTPGDVSQPSAGAAYICAQAKNFRIANPDPSQPDTEIWYACVEGPEVAAYIRGTAELVDGYAAVSFPKHFRAVASENGMTVHATPHSADSRGLAITKRSTAGIVVEELQDGQGTYKFNYFVVAVRKGFEGFEVIHPVGDSPFTRSVSAKKTPADTRAAGKEPKKRGK